MDETERLVRILTEFALAIAIALMLATPILPYGIIVGYLFTHSLSFVLNGHLTCLTRRIRKDYPALTLTVAISTLMEMKSRICRENSISGAAVFGSFAGEEFTGRSDLDIRLIRKPGVIMGIRACYFAMLERARATLRDVPLDLYVVDKPLNLFRQVKREEHPIILWDPGNIFTSIYGGQVSYLEPLSAPSNCQ